MKKIIVLFLAFLSVFILVCPYTTVEAIEIASISGPFEKYSTVIQESDLSMTQMIRIPNSEYVFVANFNSTSGLALFTFRVWNTNGTVQNKVIDTYVYGSTIRYYLSMTHVSGNGGAAGDIFAVYSARIGDVRTFRAWGSNGTIQKKNLFGKTISSSAMVPYENITMLAGTNITAFIASNRWLRTYTVNNNTGEFSSDYISSVTLGGAAGQCTYGTITQIDSNTLLVSYRNTSAGASAGYYLKTYNFTSAGVLSGTGLGASSYILNNATLFNPGCTHSVVKVTTDIYSITGWDSGDDTLDIATIRVWSNGTIQQTVIGSQPNAVSDVHSVHAWPLGNNTFITTYHGRTAGNVKAAFFNISNAGSVSKPFKTWESGKGDITTFLTKISVSYMGNGLYTLLSYDDSERLVLNTFWKNMSTIGIDYSPIFSNPSPINGSTVSNVTTTSFTIDINDPEGNTTYGNISLYNSNVAHEAVSFISKTEWTNQANGTRTHTVSLQAGKYYFVKVTLTDKNAIYSGVYWFYTPYLSGIDPVSGPYIKYDTETDMGAVNRPVEMIRIPNSDFFVYVMSNSAGDSVVFRTYRCWNTNGTVQNKDIHSYTFTIGANSYYLGSMVHISGNGSAAGDIFAIYLPDATGSITTVRAWGSNGTIQQKNLDTEASTDYSTSIRNITLVGPSSTAGSYIVCIVEGASSISTYEINGNTGAISARIDTQALGFTPYAPSLTMVDSNTILLSAGLSGTGLVLQTWNISNAGAITGAGDGKSYYASSGVYNYATHHSITHVYGDVFLVAGRTSADDSLKLASYKIYGNGTINPTVIDTETPGDIVPTCMIMVYPLGYNQFITTFSDNGDFHTEAIWNNVSDAGVITAAFKTWDSGKGLNANRFSRQPVTYMGNNLYVIGGFESTIHPVFYTFWRNTSFIIPFLNTAPVMFYPNLNQTLWANASATTFFNITVEDSNGNNTWGIITLYEISMVNPYPTTFIENTTWTNVANGSKVFNFVSPLQDVHSYKIIVYVTDNLDSITEDYWFLTEFNANLTFTNTTYSLGNFHTCIHAKEMYPAGLLNSLTGAPWVGWQIWERADYTGGYTNYSNWKVLSGIYSNFTFDYHVIRGQTAYIRFQLWTDANHTLWYTFPPFLGTGDAFNYTVVNFTVNFTTLLLGKGDWLDNTTYSYWEWDFGDGNFISGAWTEHQNLTHTYSINWSNVNSTIMWINFTVNHTGSDSTFTNSYYGSKVISFARPSTTPDTVFIFPTELVILFLTILAVVVLVLLFFDLVKGVMPWRDRK